jgi:hypothetical protein
MKRLFTFVITMLLGASLAFAVPQSTGGSTDTTTQKGKKGSKTSKAHKGGKKSKKGSKGGDTAAPPK